MPGWECTIDSAGISTCTAICGNGKIDTDKGETCDTGNALYATLKRDNSGTGSVVKTVNPNYNASLIGNGYEGCSSDCKAVQPGYQCFANTSNTTQGGLCWHGCGDGNFTGVIPGLRDTPLTYPIEECDDGNNIDGDGCSRTCQLEDPLNNF